MPGVDAKLVQLSQQLETRFFDLLPELTRPGKTPEEITQNKLSRSLAALAISMLANQDDVTASNAVIDDFDDNGIDAICFDRSENRLLFVQAKFKKDGGEPDLADTLKFAGGVRDALKRKYDRFNDAFQGKLEEVEDALDEATLNIVLVLAWTGNSLSKHSVRTLKDLEEELNRYWSGRCTVEMFTLERSHQMLAQRHAPVPINLTLTLENWNYVRTPISVFYGQLSVSQLSTLYKQYKRQLFDRNIRFYKGSSDVNDAIAKTIVEEPKYLFHLNNGLTAICQKITPKPTALPERGDFELTDFSIVNGAQTIGSIAAVAQDIDLANSDGRVQITLIELQNAPAEFGTRLTYARNFQNQVRPLDFAALDPVQERIRRELQISGIIYHYRSSAEATRRDDVTLTIEEAAISLACFKGKTDLAVALKKEVGKIFVRTGAFYPILFNEHTDAVWVVRAVRAYRLLDGMISGREAGPEKLFYRYMRYFILHILARRSKVLRKPELSISADDQLVLSRELDDLGVLIYNSSQPFIASKGYLALSRNLTDCVQLAQSVMTTAQAQQNAANLTLPNQQQPDNIEP
jgi:hypothetical protein